MFEHDPPTVPARYGMATEDGDLAVQALLARVAGLPLDELVAELHEGAALVASMHPELRSSALVHHLVADALALRG